MPNCTATIQPCQTGMDSKGMVLLAIATITEIASKPACPVEAKLQTLTAVQCSHPVSTMYRASDISRGRGPAKFRLFSEILRNSQKNAKYREIRQKYFQIHVGKTYLILILAIRPVLFTSNVQIYLETSSLQRINNVPKLLGVLRLMLRKTGH